MTTYISPFTGQTINPSSVSYEALSITANTTLDWPINGTTGIPASNIIDITATAGLSLTLPPATQVSTGQTILIRNIGSNSITIRGYSTNNTGPTIVAIASGVANYIYLTNNTTDAGTWATVVLGAGTAAANASDLAGYGLQAIGTTLNQIYSVDNYYSDATLPVTEQAHFVVWGGGAGTLTLPSAGSSGAGAGWFCQIRNNGTGILTITPAGTDTIDGNASQQLQLTESLVIVSNGTGWNTFGYGRSNSFAYTLLSLSVTGGTLTLSSTQAANTIQEYGGVLTSNQVIVVPSTVQLYSVTNNTTGSYTFTVKTAVGGAASVVVGQSATVILTCDGTNVYATSGSGGGGSSSFSSITLGNGSTSVPSLKFTGDANSGIYLPSSGQVGMVASNTQVGYWNTSGLTMAGTGTFLGGVAGGTF
jgi:hypothetical protein